MGQSVHQNEKSNYSFGSPRRLHMESRDDWLKMVLTGGWLSDEECVEALQLGCFPGVASGADGGVGGERRFVSAGITRGARDWSSCALLWNV